MFVNQLTTAVIQSEGYQNSMISRTIEADFNRVVADASIAGNLLGKHSLSCC